MVEFIDIPRLDIKIKDVYSLNDLVKMCEEWFVDNGFVSLENEEAELSDYETLYTHKIGAGGAFLDCWIWWRLLKYPPKASKKLTHVRYRINMDLHYLGDANELEVMHKGKKVKLNKGEIKIEIYPYVEIDPESKWEKSGVMKLVKDIFRKQIYRKEIEAHYAYLYDLAYKFHTLLKQYFKLETYMPEETTMIPPKGLL
ncbi:hypothetical protein JXB27_00455 [Candidatus Woesearchaeota archaeon]|nr:hypothetical protein [Candidatus Woesearchaeota archaeon]